MTALSIICLATIFTLILAIPNNDENYQTENSNTIQNVRRKADEIKTRQLSDSPKLEFILLDETDEELHSIQTRHRRSNQNLNTKSSTKENDNEFMFVSTSESPKEIDSGQTILDIDSDIYFRQTTRSKNADVTNIESLNDDLPEGLNTLLKRLFEALQNDSAKDHAGLSFINNTNHYEDRCQKWLDNRERVEQAFPGSIDELPACPCRFPNDIFYDDMIWDKNRQKKFRWRDASNDPQRSIYKRSSVYCVRSFPAQGTENIGAQHCCYDEQTKLLTRGSGAGTPYIVSPDISFVLHDKIDLLPWRLCKGDFSRYNKVRVPNNENNCKVNPDDEEYEDQVENAKNY